MIDLHRFDPTDANVGSEAAERSNRLEKVIAEYLEWYAAGGSNMDPLDALNEFNKKFKKAIASNCPSRKV
jgi:hypothetical protein